MSEWENSFGECEPEMTGRTSPLDRLVDSLLSSEPILRIHPECTGNCDNSHGEVSNSGSEYRFSLSADEIFDRQLTDRDIIFLHEYARVSSR